MDTSALIPLFLSEPMSLSVAEWHAKEKSELVAAAWCVTEFGSALGIKQRTGAINAQQASAAWGSFERMMVADLRLLSVMPAHFHRAAELVLDASSGLRAGDALHLACAEAAGVEQIATLDDVLSRNARRLKIKRVALRDLS